MKPLHCLTLLALSAGAWAGSLEIFTLTPSGPGQSLGVVEYEDNPYGLLLTPRLSGLPPGIHGFHVHDKPSCEAREVNGVATPGSAAEGHWDPDNTGLHLGPYTPGGHRGDLPALYVDASGKASYPVLAPRLKAADLKGHSLMIHAGGDNHSDHPAKLGGGGARLACGVF
ncbi:superoxide dismutase family protein [Paludibacterium paludis]|uniref:Superoxide dismutase [Cu-Zn] n=1 Tax=Paludibacterium paludis TaxID=1225769 RepID=A0A918UBR6_9NEIS|nr:superoxide dismutase family protein [Paludibacterium paludis]GGY24251.1 superoxide dismutase [Cu-Zn] [Paludibacterium paludis]